MMFSFIEHTWMEHTISTAPISFYFTSADFSVARRTRSYTTGCGRFSKSEFRSGSDRAVRLSASPCAFSPATWLESKIRAIWTCSYRCSARTGGGGWIGSIGMAARASDRAIEASRRRWPSAPSRLQKL